MYVCANGIDDVKNFAFIKSVSSHYAYFIFKRTLNSGITHMRKVLYNAGLFYELASMLLC